MTIRITYIQCIVCSNTYATYRLVIICIIFYYDIINIYIINDHLIIRLSNINV